MNYHSLLYPLHTKHILYVYNFLFEGVNVNKIQLQAPISAVLSIDHRRSWGCYFIECIKKLT